METNFQEQLAWASFFSQWVQRMQTLHSLCLKKTASKEMTLDWEGAFELFQTTLKEIPFDFQTFSKDFQSFSEEISTLLQDILSEKKSENFGPDKRFTSSLWQTHPVYRVLHQNYLLFCGQIERHLSNMTDMDQSQKRKLFFYAKQFMDALSPAHFVMTNPEVLQMTFQTQGQNIIEGLDRLIEDMQRNESVFQISMTDLGTFSLGENIATTPGHVIYENALMQLIQYEPQTETVHKTPLLIIPPWINKYYILDLNPGQSLIRWLVQQGYTVFTISWVNPDASYANKQFEDYLLEGPLTALDVILKATGESGVHAVGYCIGGTLLACMLCYLAHHGQDRVVSGTYLTTLLDFSEPGDLGVFVDEKQIASLEALMEKNGFLDGKVLANLFNSLRANDLVWSYYIQHYLQGAKPAPADVLFWNSDSSNLTKASHGFYLRNFYLENRLARGNLRLSGAPMNLGSIQVPAYFLSTEQDHIAPWKSTYQGMKLHGGHSTFVLSGSGHVMGVINSPVKNKYYYYTQPGSRRYQKADSFLKHAQKKSGSWWMHWNAWLQKHSDDKVLPRWPGENGLSILEPAPGSYAKNIRRNLLRKSRLFSKGNFR